MDIMKPGRIVLVLRGKYAGKKAVIISTHEKTEETPFRHALITGIERPPKKITKSMSMKKMNSRMKIKPFTKIVNYNHVIPTRYAFTTELKQIMNISTYKDPARRSLAKKDIKRRLRSRYIEGKRSWLYKPLRF